MLFLQYLLLLTHSLTLRQIPAGTPLHIRLTTTLGSYASKAGTPIQAILIAPVSVDGRTVLPAGSKLMGQVEAVSRVGLGIRHETASLTLEFNHLSLPGQDAVPLSARVSQIDNAIERVTRDGRIRGLRATDSGGYRVSGYVRMALLRCEMHAALAVWLVKSAVIKVAEPEIYFPAGSELTLTLTEPLRPKAIPSAPSIRPDFSDIEREELSHIVSSLPARSYAPESHRDSDLTNVLLIGSRDEVAVAFHAAGWTEALPASVRGRLRWLRAIGERRGFSSAPMSPLLLNGAGPDMCWEKSLNDVSKRHHIRLWKQPGEWKGRELWIGAATHDVDLAYLRPGQYFTHKIARDVDEEREKIAYDLVFTSCAAILDRIDRPDVPRFAQNGTGDLMTTDRRVVAVQLKRCVAPRLYNETVDTAPVPVHGGKWAVFARREILSARNDLLRDNWYWRSYEAARVVIQYVRVRLRTSSGLKSFLQSFRPAALREQASVIP